MKLLVDMNLSPTWVAFLDRMQITTVHWSAIGAPDASDHDIMEYARDHELIVLTSDLDFSAILASSSASRPSVIQLRAHDLRPSQIGERVVAAINRFKQELTRGAVLTIDVSNARVRLLPFAET
ncbi:DUF5615 family PIN-like protein [Rhizobium sp.]